LDDLRRRQEQAAAAARCACDDPGAGLDFADLVHAVTIRNRTAEPESVARLQELRQTLGLRAGAEEFPLELADVPNGPDELAVQSRTLFSMLQAL